MEKSRIRVLQVTKWVSILLSHGMERSLRSTDWAKNTVVMLPTAINLKLVQELTI